MYRCNYSQSAFRRRNASQTLAQNYTRLGLTSKLNARAGGIEPRSSTFPAACDDANSFLPGQKKHDPLAIPSQAAPKSLIPTTARVVRDPETGKILRVVGHDSPPPAAGPQKKNKNPLNDLLNELESDDELEDGGRAREVVNVGSTAVGGIVEQLEAAAMAGIKKTRPRMQSRREEEWIEALVRRWGENYKGMMSDRRLNPMQQSEGDLRRRIERWKEGRGNIDVEAAG